MGFYFSLLLLQREHMIYLCCSTNTMSSSKDLRLMNVSMLFGADATCTKDESPTVDSASTLELSRSDVGTAEQIFAPSDKGDEF